jgi:hypothetical protein
MKKAVSLRLDADVIAWLKKGWRGMPDAGDIGKTVHAELKSSLAAGELELIMEEVRKPMIIQRAQEKIFIYRDIADRLL